MFYSEVLRSSSSSSIQRREKIKSISSNQSRSVTPPEEVLSCCAPQINAVCKIPSTKKTSENDLGLRAADMDGLITNSGEVINQNDILLQGVLLKVVNIIKGDRPRYFVLVPNKLLYYE
ncbi:MAG: hypothetical protein MHPSP_000363, partial [Paramarteilia canceri]